MMISRQFMKAALSSSLPRLLSEQTRLLPRQCRHCCQQHMQLHTSNMMKQEMVLDLPSKDVDKVERVSNIEHMETESGASICLDKNGSSGITKCVISGSEDSIKAARRLIDECISQTKKHELVLDVPSTDVNKLPRQNILKNMETQSGASISLDKNRSGDVTKCFITGSESSVETARKLIDEYISQTKEMVLDLSAEDADKVLNKKASIIKKLKRKSGAQVYVDKSISGGLSKCVITGSDEAITKARQLLDEIINETQNSSLEETRSRHIHDKPILSDSEATTVSFLRDLDMNKKDAPKKAEPRKGVQVNSLLSNLKAKPSGQRKMQPLKGNTGKNAEHMAENKSLSDASATMRKSSQSGYMKRSQSPSTFTVPDAFHTLVSHRNFRRLPTEVNVKMDFTKSGSSYQLSITGAHRNISECKRRLQKLCDETVHLTLDSHIQKRWFGIDPRVLENMFDVVVSVIDKDDLLITGDQDKIQQARKELIEFLQETKAIPHGRLDENALFKPAFSNLTFEEKLRGKVQSEGKENVVTNNKSGSSKWEMLMKKALEEKQSVEFPSELSSSEKAESTDKSSEAVSKDLNLTPRPPVVTIMGHVDHGKTTLLDALRKSNVVSQEFGGITQHIGAFQVQLKSGHSITFLDTPGHAAFSNMRSRGASVTDVIVLVVAAEDGIMNQTLESINHAKRANVPVVVAINKIDHPRADPERVKYQLAEYGLVAEELGGDIQIIPISALKRENLDKLQESIIVQTEVLDLKARTSGKVEGSVIEAKVDSRRGRQVTTLIQSGTLRKGDYLIAGKCGTKVRNMFNDQGKAVREATPGTPVVVTGWETLPSAGDRVYQAENEAEVRQTLAEIEKQEREEMILAAASDATAEERRKKLHEDYLYMRRMRSELHWKERNALHRARKGDVIDEGLHKFPVILKADVDGSLEVLEENLNAFQSEHIELSIVSSGVGDINKGDMELAESAGARIYGFNVKQSDILDKKYDVRVVLNNVIYSLFDQLVKDMQSEMPTFEEKLEIGRAKVLQIFEVSDKIHKKVKIAGCQCQTGTLKKDGLYRIVRNDHVIYEGQLLSMKIKSKEVGTVNEGNECGLGLESSIDLQQDDEIICLTSEVKQMKLKWDHIVQHEQ